MKHLLAVQQVCASLAQVTQIYLHRREIFNYWRHWWSCGPCWRAAFLWTCLNISEQFGQVKLPLFAEAGELQQEADCVIGLVQTGQALHRSDRIQTLSRREA